MSTSNPSNQVAVRDPQPGPMTAARAIAAASAWLDGPDEMSPRALETLRAPASFTDGALVDRARALAVPVTVNARGEEAVGALRRWLSLVRCKLCVVTRPVAGVCAVAWHCI